MNNKLLLFLLLTTIMVSCSIEKRLYRPGLHVSFHSNKALEGQPQEPATDVPKKTETKNGLTEKSDRVEKDTASQNEIIDSLIQKKSPEDYISSSLEIQKDEPKKENVQSDLQEKESDVLEEFMAHTLKNVKKFIRFQPKQIYQNKKSNGGLFTGLAVALFFVHFLLLILFSTSAWTKLYFLILAMLAFLASLVFSFIGAKSSKKGSALNVIAVIIFAFDLLLLFCYSFLAALVLSSI